jgi:uncharacterized protein (TIGR02453 family)
MAQLSRKYIKFFKELAANNEREWFHANKKRYEEEVKVPFEALVQDVIDRMKKIDPEVQVIPKECIFRIYRDTRFSKDKTPYKLHMAAGVGKNGKSHSGKPGIYFQVGPEKLEIAGGCWQPEKDLLTKIRSAIVADPKRVERILNAKKFKETFGELGGDKNKILPKEFKVYGSDIPLLFNKSYHYWASYKGQKYLLADDIAKFIVDHYKIAGKWNEFLAEVME